ncbi:MAG: hypothetical protein M0Q99_00620 [Candidatus Cloacimonetes bacterium]|jgi:hypothetical protein|nr:hypothetical protein [Candidatus Cloacimonadota bacterium]MDY0336826.1 hypothetical protein [Candidatus Cloacimonadaceae bacterium]
MLGILKNQSGNLAIAMLLAVVGMMSGLTMSGVAMRDTRTFHWEYENLQGMHMLRSESNRGLAILAQHGDLVGSILTPLRSVAVSSTSINRTFTLQSRVTKEKSEQTENVIITGGTQATGSLGAQREHYKVKSLVETRHGAGQAAFYGANKSIVRKYGELTIIQSKFSEFMYFTDMDVSPAGKNVYFYGPDVVTGKVHSNTDINIKKAGGGSNNGWPTFLNLVTTAGHVVSDPSNYPLNEIFLGGLVEEYDGYDFPPQANELRSQATHIGAGDGNIYLINVEGASWRGLHGIIGPTRRISKIVYDEYPPEGDSLYTNNFTVQDTLWTPLSGGQSANRAFFIKGELWLQGLFSGYQTWGCSGNIYLLDDIALTNTPINANPINNSTDVVGIVSEKSIILKYGYKNPVDSVRIHTNMGADNEYPAPAGGGIFIYAALCALGEGPDDIPSTQPNFEDGVFTYEYQHPHPSTPAIFANVEYPDGTIKEEYFDWIDIHRRRYPPTASQPWPSPALGQQSLDLPWYNPLWPERQPYLERGTINIWGALAQRRRGFVHRSGNDGEYPSNDGIWNVELDMCGYPISRNPLPDPVFGNQLGLISMNYPGTSGGGTGYKKNYNYDNRLLTVTPLLYPEVRLKGGKNPMQDGNWTLKKPPRTLQ